MSEDISLFEQKLIALVIDCAAQQQLVVEGIFLIGSTAHGFATESSDYDIKAIVRYAPEKYTGVLRIPSFTKQVMEIQDTPLSESSEVNITFMNIQRVAADIRVGSGVAWNFFDWIKTQRCLLMSSNLQRLVTLAMQTYLAPPVIAQTAMGRMTSFYYAVARNSQIDAKGSLRGIQKRRQRALMACTYACDYLLSARAESFIQRFPRCPQAAMHSVIRSYSELADCELANVSTVRDCIDEWGTKDDAHDNKLLVSVIALTGKMLSIQHPKADPSVTIEGRVDDYDALLYQIICGK